MHMAALPPFVLCLLCCAVCDVSSAVPCCNHAEVLELFDSAVGLLNSTDLAAAGDAGNATAARDGVAAAVESIFELPSSLESLNTSIEGAVSLLRENFNDTIADIRSSFYGPSMAVEDTWRFVLIGGACLLCCCTASACAGPLCAASAATAHRTACTHHEHATFFTIWLIFSLLGPQVVLPTLNPAWLVCLWLLQPCLARPSS
jgi:hypothetical protein